jgi:hypothetical protein
MTKDVGGKADFTFGEYPLSSSNSSGTTVTCPLLLTIVDILVMKGYSLTYFGGLAWLSELDSRSLLFFYWLLNYRTFIKSVSYCVVLTTMFIDEKTHALLF